VLSAPVPVPIRGTGQNASQPESFTLAKERRILVVDDDDLVRERLAIVLASHHFSPTAVADGETALEVAEEIEFDAFFVDIQLPEIDGFELLGRLRQITPTAPVVIITSHGNLDSAVTALRAGAFDFLTKPVQPETLLLCLERIFEVRALDEENQELRKSAVGTRRVGSFIAASDALKDVLSLVRRVADSASTVLITGESGTGKDVVARALHDQSARASRPYLPINCAAIPEGLLESELFGHTKGAFSGAVGIKAGLFVEGHGGTVLLDEIGEMPEALQTKLLRFLQDREVRPVGSVHARKVDVRLIAATNRDLTKEIQAGRFRQDLYYRLNVIPIQIPPLRDRSADIVPLAHHFLERHGGSDRRFGESAISMLEKSRWTGNARELENAVERTLALSDAEEILEEDLFLEEERIGIDGDLSLDSLIASAAKEETPLRDLEDRYIDEILRRVDGNKMRAARILGVNRTTLYRRKDSDS